MPNLNQILADRPTDPQACEAQLDILNEKLPLHSSRVDFGTVNACLTAIHDSNETLKSISPMVIEQAKREYSLIQTARLALEAQILGFRGTNRITPDLIDRRDRALASANAYYAKVEQLEQAYNSALGKRSDALNSLAYFWPD